MDDWSNSGYGPMAGYCQHGNESLGSIKYGSFFDWEALTSEEDSAWWGHLIIYIWWIYSDL